MLLLLWLFICINNRIFIAKLFQNTILCHVQGWKWGVNRGTESKECISRGAESIFYKKIASKHYEHFIHA